MKVISKQGNSRMCFICGVDNENGVKAHFYNMEDGSVCSLFKFKEEHQSYPKRVHGGISSAMLDELGCRAFWVDNPRKLAVTLDLSVKYRKRVPYDEELIGVGKVIKSTNRFIVAHCQIMNKEKEVLVEGEMKYLILSEEKIDSPTLYDDEMVYFVEDDIKEINI